MAGEGGGGGGGGAIPWDEEREKYGVFTYFMGRNRPPDYTQKGWVAKHVPWFTNEAWKNPETRRILVDAAYQVWRNLKLADPRSDLSRKASKTAAGREMLRATRHAQANQQQPPDPPPTRQGPVTTTDRVLELVRLWLQSRQQEEQARAARRQQRAAARVGGSMPFPQLSGGFGFSPNLSLPSVGGGGFASSLLDALPGVLTAASPLIANLFEQEATEAPDLLERLGLATGLEGAVEREATFWIPTASGVRANPEIMARNPVTGRLSTWKNMGRPVLYSGDLATCKRVNKISSRVARVARRGSLPARRARRR